MSYDFDHQPRGMSSGAKVAIGCGAFALLTFVVICGGSLLLWDRVADDLGEFVDQVAEKVEGFATRFEAQGYQRVTGQVVEISSDVKRPTVYTVQAFELNANAEASLAVMAQVAEINGNIDGDLHFFGQALTISQNVVITGNVYVELAQVFENEGTIQGEVVHAPAALEPEELVPDEAEATDDSVLKPSPGDVIETPAADEPSAEGETATEQTLEPESSSPPENDESFDENSAPVESSEEVESSQPSS